MPGFPMIARPGSTLIFGTEIFTRAHSVRTMSKIDLAIALTSSGSSPST